MSFVESRPEDVRRILVALLSLGEGVFHDDVKINRGNPVAVWRCLS